jgi:hypothetical protein
LERHLKHIPTTSTAVEKLKRSAKNLRKETKTSLAVAQATIAKSAGYDNWKHVTVCLEQTKPLPKQNGHLPQVLADFLAQSMTDMPPSPAEVDAMNNGLVFAMDVKDSEQLKLGNDIIECESAWVIAATDMWKILVHAKDDEADKSLAELEEGDELLSTVQDDLMNYRFFQYVGNDVPTSLEKAYADIFQHFFFPPRYVWTKGKFIDMSDPMEIKIDGKVVFHSTDGIVVSGQIPSSERVLFHEAAASPSVPSSRSGFIPLISISKLTSSLYEYDVTYGGQEMYSDAGFTSINEALAAASDTSGDIEGYTVEYQGIMVGTYPAAFLQSSPESVARDAIATAAPFIR